MYSYERSYYAKIATALAIATGTFALAGCGKPEQRNAVAGGLHLTDDGVLHVPGESAGEFSTLHCEGHILEQHIEKRHASDPVYDYVHDPSCQDGKLTKSDFSAQLTP